MFRNEFKNALIAASLTLLSGPVVFASSTPAAPVDQRRAEYRAHQEMLSQIDANRQRVIQAIVNDWANVLSSNSDSHWGDGITTALNKASNEELLQIQDADSYSVVQEILQGKLGPLRSGQQLLSGSAANNAIAPASLGDSAADLVFTPVFPCRIYDTRNQNPPLGAPYGNATTTANAGNTRSYVVHGTGAQIGAQGGNPAGCHAPNGEPSAIAANFTVVPIATAGHITVYPYGGSLPDSSMVNFYAGTNIANAGIVQTAFMAPPPPLPAPQISYDITVYHRNTANSIADVMGYFYPARPVAAMASGTTITNPSNPGALYSDGAIHSFGPSARISITSPSQKVFWTAHHAVGTLQKTVTIPGAGDLDIYACYKYSGDTVWQNVGAGAFNITMLGIQKNIVSESAVIAPAEVDLSNPQNPVPPLGDYDFGLCYITHDPYWNNNEYGYVAAQRN